MEDLYHYRFGWLRAFYLLGKEKGLQNVRCRVGSGFTPTANSKECKGLRMWVMVHREDGSDRRQFVGEKGKIVGHRNRGG